MQAPRFALRGIVGDEAGDLAGILSAVRQFQRLHLPGSPQHANGAVPHLTDVNLSDSFILDLHGNQQRGMEVPGLAPGRRRQFTQTLANVLHRRPDAPAHSLLLGFQFGAPRWLAISEKRLLQLPNHFPAADLRRDPAVLGGTCAIGDTHNRIPLAGSKSKGVLAMRPGVRVEPASTRGPGDQPLARSFAALRALILVNHFRQLGPLTSNFLRAPQPRCWDTLPRGGCWLCARWLGRRASLSCLGGSFYRLDGSLPYLDGSLPHLDGSLPHLDGSLPHLAGSLSRLNGSLSRLDGTLSRR